MLPWLVVITVMLSTQLLQGVHGIANGHNFYKDLLRGKLNDVAELYDTQLLPESSKLMYFYQIPTNNEAEDQHNTEFGKRSPNFFKNYMLNRDPNGEETLETESSEQSKEPELINRYSFPRTIREAISSLGVADLSTISKRGPGTSISWALSAKRPYIEADLSFLFSLLRPYRRMTKLSRSIIPNSFYATKGKRSQW